MSAEPKEYAIRSVKKSGEVWSNSYGKFQSYAMALEGWGEPVKMNKTVPVAREPQVGDVLYGHLVNELSANNRMYYRFVADSKSAPDANQQCSNAQFAVRLATDVWLAQGAEPDAYSNILVEAVSFYKMIPEVIKEGERPS